MEVMGNARARAGCVFVKEEAKKAASSSCVPVAEGKKPKKEKKTV